MTLAKVTDNFLHERFWRNFEVFVLILLNHQRRVMVNDDDYLKRKIMLIILTAKP